MMDNPRRALIRGRPQDGQRADASAAATDATPNDADGPIQGAREKTDKRAESGLQYAEVPPVTATRLPAAAMQATMSAIATAHTSTRTGQRA